MRTTPATSAEVDAWLTVLHRRGHLKAVQEHPDGTWTVQERSTDEPWTLHHPVLAMDWITQVVRRIRVGERNGRR
ncbi:hypothetical protein OG783_28790 [Streptomyces jietaisiensis]|uniref:hypothetical protein n=1 Tax=Streptomyces griseoaurantiacus TaxID=68213 RepID=UPI00324BACAA